MVGHDLMVELVGGGQHDVVVGALPVSGLVPLHRRRPELKSRVIVEGGGLLCGGRWYEFGDAIKVAGGRWLRQTCTTKVEPRSRRRNPAQGRRRSRWHGNRTLSIWFVRLQIYQICFDFVGSLKCHCSVVIFL
jgi:hypothetical protein